jgi:hypothetical protein
MRNFAKVLNWAFFELSKLRLASSRPITPAFTRSSSSTCWGSRSRMREAM